MNFFKMLIMILSCLIVCAGAFSPNLQSSAASSSEKPDGPMPGEKKKGTSDLERPSERNTPITSQPMPVYRPPLRGIPEGLVAGGARFKPSLRPLPRFFLEHAVLFGALVPDHVGLTVQEQPNLYWFIADLPSSRINFTLIEADSTIPLIDERLKNPKQAGIQCIRLAEHSIHLRENTRYKWLITLATSLDHRAIPAFAGGFIERVPVPGGLEGKLQKAGKRGEHYVYAEEGIWYDALATLSELIEKEPLDATLRRERASILKQAGLEEVAAYDLE
jgi:hypothetical protein